MRERTQTTDWTMELIKGLLCNLYGLGVGVIRASAHSCLEVKSILIYEDSLVRGPGFMPAG